MRNRLEYGRGVCLLLAAIWGAGLISLSAAEITVFAAASLSDALRELGAAYQEKTGDQVTFNFAASSTLARQIEEGAPADVFFSADEPRMEALAAKGLIVQETRRNRLSNTLVIVVAARDGAPVKRPSDLAGPAIRRIALGDPRAVPIGVYAKAWLEKLGLWAAIERKVVGLENARAALTAVEAGNAEASIVYKTDAAISKKVRVAFEVPADQTPGIRYPLALLKTSKSPRPARKFLDYLNSSSATEVFAKHGFGVLDEK